MKQYLAVMVVALAGVAAVIAIQRGHFDTRPSAQTLLHAVADAQHEAARVPAHFVTMSDADEIAAGNELAKHASSFPSASHADVQRNTAVEAYLQAVGERTAAHARRKLPWSFHYISDPKFVNAFALPGGHIFIGEGLLMRMQSEDALSGVLGHEIEHVDLRHCAERLEMEAQLRRLGGLGDLAALPAELFLAGYSKDQELEADRDGTTLTVEAGYSYAGVLKLFRSLDDSEIQNGKAIRKADGPVHEATQLSLATLSGYFATHPPAAQRCEQIQQLAEANKWPREPVTSLKMRFDVPT